MHGGNIYEQQIKYDFSVNLNPYEDGQLLESAYCKAFRSMKAYPDLKQRAFLENISKMEGLSINQVIGGNGASELFMAIVRAIKPKTAVLICPSFSGYEYVLNSLENCKVINYYLTKENDFEIGLDFAKFIEKLQSTPDMVFLANPNNPTGRAVQDKVMLEILEICQTKSINLLIDECFIKLTENGQSLKKKIPEYSNLYVVDAFTKCFSIPGARVGYLCSQQQNISRVRTQLPEWNLSILGQELGCRCAEILMKENFREESLKLIREERSFLEDKLRECGIRVFPSDANYLLLETKMDLAGLLKKQGILIRDCRDYHGLEPGYFRVAVKEHEANLKLIEAIVNLTKG